GEEDALAEFRFVRRAVVIVKAAESGEGEEEAAAIAAEEGLVDFDGTEEDGLGLVKLFLHEIDAREDTQAVRDFVAGFAKGLFIYLNRLRIELLGGGIIVADKRAGAEGLEWHGNHGRKGAVKLLDNLELAGVRSIGGGKVLSHVLVPELVEGGNEARVMRLNLLCKLDRLLVLDARNIKAPLGGGRRTGLHGLVQLHGQIRSRARCAQARFQCGS